MGKNSTCPNLQSCAFQCFWQIFHRQRRRRQSRLIVTMQYLSARMYQPLATLVFLASAVFRITEACSSRSTPKPRPPLQSTRPNITFPTFECPREYQSHFCLNGARCFTVKIENSVLYNCECTEGFTGPRCEFKDPDGSYLLNRGKVMIETASIAGGVTVAVLLIVIIFIAIYVHLRRNKTSKSCSDGAEMADPRYSRSRNYPPLRGIRTPRQDAELGIRNFSELSDSEIEMEGRNPVGIGVGVGVVGVADVVVADAAAAGRPAASHAAVFSPTTSSCHSPREPKSRSDCQ